MDTITMKPNLDEPITSSWVQSWLDQGVDSVLHYRPIGVALPMVSDQVQHVAKSRNISLLQHEVNIGRNSEALAQKIGRYASLVKADRFIAKPINLKVAQDRNLWLSAGDETVADNDNEVITPEWFEAMTASDGTVPSVFDQIVARIQQSETQVNNPVTTQSPVRRQRIRPVRPDDNLELFGEQTPVVPAVLPEEVTIVPEAHEDSLFRQMMRKVSPNPEPPAKLETPKQIPVETKVTASSPQGVSPVSIENSPTNPTPSSPRSSLFQKMLAKVGRTENQPSEAEVIPQNIPIKPNVPANVEEEWIDEPVAKPITTKPLRIRPTAEPKNIESPTVFSPKPKLIQPESSDISTIEISPNEQPKGTLPGKVQSSFTMLDPATFNLPKPTLAIPQVESWNEEALLAELEDEEVSNDRSLPERVQTVTFPQTEDIKVVQEQNQLVALNDPILPPPSETSSRVVSSIGQEVNPENQVMLSHNSDDKVGAVPVDMPEDAPSRLPLGTTKSLLPIDNPLNINPAISPSQNSDNLGYISNPEEKSFINNEDIQSVSRHEAGHVVFAPSQTDVVKPVVSELGNHIPLEEKSASSIGLETGKKDTSNIETSQLMSQPHRGANIIADSESYLLHKDTITSRPAHSEHPVDAVSKDITNANVKPVEVTVASRLAHSEHPVDAVSEDITNTNIKPVEVTVASRPAHSEHPMDVVSKDITNANVKPVEVMVASHPAHSEHPMDVVSEDITNTNVKPVEITVGAATLKSNDISLEDNVFYQTTSEDISSTKAEKPLLDYTYLQVADKTAQFLSSDTPRVEDNKLLYSENIPAISQTPLLDLVVNNLAHPLDEIPIQPDDSSQVVTNMEPRLTQAEAQDVIFAQNIGPVVEDRLKSVSADVVPGQEDTGNKPNNFELDVVSPKTPLDLLTRTHLQESTQEGILGVSHKKPEPENLLEPLINYDLTNEVDELASDKKTSPTQAHVATKLQPKGVSNIVPTLKPTESPLGLSEDTPDSIVGLPTNPLEDAHTPLKLTSETPVNSSFPKQLPLAKVTPKLQQMATKSLLAQGWRFKQREGTQVSLSSPTRIARAINDLTQPSDSGRSLDVQTKQSMESVLGQDFSQVRIHKASLSGLNVQAAAKGRDVYVESDSFDTPESMALLGHELTHVAQQGFATPLTSSHVPSIQRSVGQDEFEAEQAEVKVKKFFTSMPMAHGSAVQQQPSQAETDTIGTDLPMARSVHASRPSSPIIQRAIQVEDVQTDVQPQSETNLSSQGGENESHVDLGHLAQKIYPLIKQKLRIERELIGGR